MNRLSLWALRVLLLLCLSLPGLNAVDLLVNGERQRSWNSPDLSAAGYRIPGTERTGVFLSVLVPPLYEFRHIRIGTAQGVHRLSGGEARQLMTRSYLVPGVRNSWDLFGPDERSFRDVREIDITGELLEGRELEIWISWEGTRELEEEIREYARRHGLDIRTVTLPNPAAKYLSVLRGRGQLPDLIMLSAGDLDRLVYSDGLQPLPASLLEDILPLGRENFYLDGRYWAAPFYFDSQVLFYNPRLVDLSGYPGLTLDQLEEIGRSLVPSVPVPLAWNAYSVTWLTPFQHAFGKTDILNRDGGITMDDPASRQALEYLVDLNRQDCFRPLEKDAMLSFFAAGKAAVILSASYSIPYFEELGIPFAIARFPVHPETGLAVSPLLDFKAFGISKRSRNPLLARQLLSYLTGPGVQQRFPVALSKLPVNQPVARMVRSWNPYYPVLLDSAENGTVLPSGKAYGVYKNIMWKLLRFALTGQMSPREVLRKGQQLWEEEMKNAADP